MSRAFSTSYLAGEPSARDFIPRDFRDGTARVAAARQAAERGVSATLATVLREQQARLPASAARQANLDALTAGGTAVVVTGQQVGLFLGPLYTVYKAASAVAVARAIEAESGVRCVPLFWLQTEDQDFAEIASTTVASRDGSPVRLALTEDRPGDEARVSVAHRVLGAEVAPLLDALADALPEGEAANEVVALLRAHYVAGRPLAAAFAGVLATLFADEGLLLLDPRDARVAALAAPLTLTAINTADVVEGLLAERSAALAAAGFGEQVAVRQDCALVFFHRGRADGPRFRLEHGSDGWTLSGCGDSIAHAALLDLLAREPLRFSTSALLRPILQDALLPTVAYVGGPGEINYFAQLGPLYEHFGVAPALVVPRGRFRYLDSRTQRLLDQLALQPDDLLRPQGDLMTRLPVALPPGAPEPAALRRRIADQVAPAVVEISGAIEALDPHLARPAQRTRDAVTRALQRLLDRYTRTLVERDRIVADRLERLQQALYPGGIPQERYYGWPSLAGRHGGAALKQLVLARLDAEGPFSTDLHDLRP